MVFLFYPLPVCMLSQFSSVQLCNLIDHSPSDSAVQGVLQARILEWAPLSSPGDFPDPGIKSKSPLSPALQANSLPLSHRESPFFPLRRIKSQESLDSFLSFPPDIKIVPENFLLMLLYQHLFHLSILFHFHKLLLPNTWILQLHFPSYPCLFFFQ